MRGLGPFLLLNRFVVAADTTESVALSGTVTVAATGAVVAALPPQRHPVVEVNGATLGFA